MVSEEQSGFIVTVNSAVAELYKELSVYPFYLLSTSTLMRIGPISVVDSLFASYWLSSVFT